MKARRRNTLIMAALVALTAADLGAQVTEPAVATPQAVTAPEGLLAPAVTIQDPDNQTANFVRRDFQRLLQQHPSTVWQVLRVDPGLMLNEEYLVPYPALSAYLAQHPEIARNPRFFIGTPGSSSGDVMEPLAIMTIMLAIFGSLIWLIRTLIDYRRWSRLSRTQTEVHTKLLDRFTSSEDLRAYFESPAGRRFLESEPIDMGTVSSRSAPSSKILWSLQVGVIIALGGAGLHFAIPGLAEAEAADPLRVLGTIAIALGVGFMLSAAASYILSQRLGLLTPSGSDTGGETQSR